MRNFTSAEILYSIISRPDKGGRSAVDLFNFRSEETTKTDPEGFAALCGKLEKLVANGYLTKYGKRYQVMLSA